MDSKNAAPVSVSNTAYDGIRLEVLRNLLEGIGDGMALTVVRASRSSIVRASLDFSTGVLSANGDLIGQGLCLPIHLGGMMPALDSCLNRYSNSVKPGDIFILNDPYEGGSHLPDIFLFKPIFLDGVLLGYLCAMSHHTDIGGRVAGGNACDSSEIYQEGLRIPPLKLYAEGQPNETVFRILEKAVRVPDKVLGDLHGQLAALSYGETEYMRLAKRFGIEEIAEYTEHLVNYTEDLTRKALSSLPDGQWSFTDYVDDDGFGIGPIPIKVTLTKTADELHVDFTGTGPQCKGAMQPVFQTTKGIVCAAIKTALSALGTSIPNTAGCFRPITFTAPEGTFVNPLPPAPVAARALGCVRVFQTVMGAFAQILPEFIPACSGGTEFVITMAGYNRQQTPWKPWVLVDGFLEVCSGGYPHKDGADAQHVWTTNISIAPSETLEVEIPVQVTETNLLADSEGAGKFRGGVGIRRAYQYLTDDAIVQIRADRTEHTPYGLYGGHDSRRTYVQIASGTELTNMPSKFIETMNNKDTLIAEVPGGGGWGNPFERDPSLVLEDVIAEKVSIKRAKQVYGVVIDKTQKQINYSETNNLRKQPKA